MKQLKIKPSSLLLFVLMPQNRICTPYGITNTRTSKKENLASWARYATLGTAVERTSLMPRPLLFE